MAVRESKPVSQLHPGPRHGATGQTQEPRTAAVGPRTIHLDSDMGVRKADFPGAREVLTLAVLTLPVCRLFPLNITLESLESGWQNLTSNTVRSTEKVVFRSANCPT